MIIKNSNLRILIFHNRYKILAIIVAIILFFSVLTAINQLAKEKLEMNNETSSISQNSNLYKPEQTVLSGTTVGKEQQEKNEKLIDNFIKYCKNGNVQEAYNLLSDECKEQIFLSDINNFSNNYIKKIFSKDKIYSIQSWINGIGNTYKIKFTEDILATGNVQASAIEDYYTIVRKDNEYKLNISNYIGRTTVNKTGQKENIKITIISKDIYKDYIIYNFMIQNNTNSNIMIDSKEHIDSTYLKNESDNKYPAYIYEIEDSRLIVNAQTSKKISIRFNKTYFNKLQMTALVFDDVIANVEEYEKIENKQNYANRISLQVSNI